VRLWCSAFSSLFFTVILASQNKFGSATSFSMLCYSLRITGFSSSLKVW
jgi:hypothetical protein